MRREQFVIIFNPILEAVTQTTFGNGYGIHIKLTVLVIFKT